MSKKIYVDLVEDAETGEMLFLLESIADLVDINKVSTYTLKVKDKSLVIKLFDKNGKQIKVGSK